MTERRTSEPPPREPSAWARERATNIISRYLLDGWVFNGDNLAQELDAARAAENEACAKTADACALSAQMSDCHDLSTQVEHRTARVIAAAIRARREP